MMHFELFLVNYFITYEYSAEFRCGHCKRVEPVFENGVAQIAEDCSMVQMGDSSAVLAMVDATEEKYLSGQSVFKSKPYYLQLAARPDFSNVQQRKDVRLQWLVTEPCIAIKSWWKRPVFDSILLLRSYSFPSLSLCRAATLTIFRPPRAPWRCYAFDRWDEDGALHSQVIKLCFYPCNRPHIFTIIWIR